MLCYHRAMKKTLFICILILLLVVGCKGAPQPAAPSPDPTERVKVEVAVITPAPSPPPTETPEPYASNENIFVPASTEEPTPEPTEIPLPSEIPGPTARYAAAEGIETVAWMSDTQHYANHQAKENVPDIYPVMTGFLRDKAEEIHLVYVVHTGDLVHVNKSLENWKVARAAMDLLGDIPNGVLAGNHDMAESGGGYKNYWKYFGEKHYNQQTCYGESFENNRGHYDLVTICGRDYIFVYMSYEPNGKAIQFIVKSFQKHPDRIGILCLHDFITTEGTLSDDGKKLREQVVAKCPNVYMVLCGHRYGLYTLEDAFDDDGDGAKERTVYEIMMNYQAAGDMGGGGYLRLMQFNEENHEIRCINYSPYRDDYDWLDDPANREKRYEMDEKSESFTLKMPWA